MELLQIEHNKKYIIKAERLWDGMSTHLQADCHVIINNGIIERLGFENTATEKDTTVANTNAANTIVVNLPSLTLMPGFTDCHVHLAMDALKLPNTIEEWSTAPESTRQRIRRFLEDFLAAGIVAIRDGGDLHGFGLEARDQVLQGQLTGPNILATGSAIFRKGYYGSFLGPGVASLREAEEQINALQQRKVDQIKVLLSGLVSFKDHGKVGKVQFTADELGAIVKLAHNRGLKVMAHASSDEAVAVGISAGVDSIEHGYFVSSDSLKRMVDRGIAWIPTVAPLGNLLQTEAQLYEGADLEVIKLTHYQQLHAINMAVELGVLLGIGTDAGAKGVYHGTSYHEELKFFVEAGLTPQIILTIATQNSASIAGLNNQGTIAPGQKPALIAVEGNPLEALEGLKAIRFLCLPPIHHRSTT